MGHQHHDHHGHDHDHAGHTHAPADFGRAFAIGIALNLAYMAAEVVYGVLGHSMALIADAGHNLSDVLGLGLAWGAMVLARRPATARYTYGLAGSSILAALANAMLLLVVTGGIAWEAILRLMAPQPVAGLTMVIVAAVGIAVNGGTALLFLSGRKKDLNIRGAFLHMASDALVTLGVVIAGAIIVATGWLWIDPAVSLLVSAVIVAGTWGLLRDSVGLALQGVPAGIDRGAVEAYLRGLPGVADVHDLHIWGMSTTETALTVHLVRAEAAADDAFLPQVTAEVAGRFGIGHATIQLETPDNAERCALRAAHMA